MGVVLEATEMVCSGCGLYRKCIPVSTGIGLCMTCDDEDTRDTMAYTARHLPATQQTQVRQGPPPAGPSHLHLVRNACDGDFTHFKLDMRRADSTQRDLFHAAMKWMVDKMDYPIDPMHKSTDRVRVCETCGGVAWRRPVKDPADLRCLAKQLGFKLKFPVWHSPGTCKGKLVESDYSAVKEML